MSQCEKSVRVLYTGIDLPTSLQSLNEEWIHHPLICVVPRSADSLSFEMIKSNLDDYTHLVFTSKSAVRIFSELIVPKSIKAVIIAVGAATANEIMLLQMPKPLISETETAEGLVGLLDTMDLTNAFVLWPHSALSRLVLCCYFQEKNIKFHHPILYDTVTNFLEKRVRLEEFDEVFFTSPSTVDAFFEIYGKPAPHLKLRSIGPITKNYLQSRLAKF